MEIYLIFREQSFVNKQNLFIRRLGVTTHSYNTGRQKQYHLLKFEASLGYIVSFWLARAM